MTAPASLNEHTLRVLAVLGVVGQLGVHRGEGPPSPHLHVPYVVVNPYPASWYGTASDPHADVDYRVQISAVGATAEQADEALDRVRVALLDPTAPLDPTGRVRSGPVTCEPLRQPIRDNDARLDSPLWTASDLYVIPTTPLT